MSLLAVLLLLHAAASVLAGFRLTELMLLDKIAAPIRERFGKYYLFSCPRCMSVWAGAAATLLPVLNWALAISWLYIAAADRRQARKQANQPLVSTGPQARPTAQRSRQMTSNDAPRPLDPELAAKLAAHQAKQRPSTGLGPQPSQAMPGIRTPDQIIKEQLGALMLQIITLQAENEQLRARVAAMPQPQPVAG